MANWVLKGLRTGIKTTPYPRQADDLPGVSPGRPSGTLLSSADRAEDLARRLPDRRDRLSRQRRRHRTRELRSLLSLPRRRE